MTAGWLFSACLSATPALANESMDVTNDIPPVTITESLNVWNLGDLYPDVEAWDKHREEIAGNIAAIAQCKDELTQSAKNLAGCMQKISDAYRQLMRLYSYSFLAKDTDLGNSTFRERASISQALYSQLLEATSFVDPALIEAGEKQLNRFLEREGNLEEFDFYIANTLRRGSHILSAREEEILAAMSDPLTTASSAYEVLTNAEIPWPEVTLSDGTVVTLNAQGYTGNRDNANRADRKLVFDAFFGTYNKYRETLGITLEGQVKQQVLLAKLHNFDSALSASLFQDNIPPEVYTSLVTTVGQNLKTLHRLVALRQGLLGTKQSYYYDVYPSVINLEKTYSLEDAKAITLKAFEPLGEEYLQLYAQSINNDWMHVYPAEGKRSGAYVMGAAYDVHPYMLLNYQDDINSLSTFAHEWGHAMHSLLANQNQPFFKSDYATFTAEIASTLNEVLLFDYLRSNAQSEEELLFYLFQELDQLRGTFFRQTQFAEFELAIHQHVEKGGALSGEKLSILYGDILKRYYGHNQNVMQIDDTYTVEWAYIPHFYRNFYVYQYATSISAAYFLADKIKSEGEPAQQRYLDVLRAGGSDYPYDILKKAGVDMAQPDVYQAVIDRANNLMDEVVRILNKDVEEKTATSASDLKG